MATTNPLQFIQQVRAEVAKVVWPTRRETMLTTVMVFIPILIRDLEVSQLFRDIAVAKLVHGPAHHIDCAFEILPLNHMRAGLLHLDLAEPVIGGGVDLQIGEAPVDTLHRQPGTVAIVDGKEDGPGAVRTSGRQRVEPPFSCFLSFGQLNLGQPREAQMPYSSGFPVRPGDHHVR